jgi:hypothetical protein
MKNIYVPITKVQDNPDGTCEIYGTAALEQVDRSKEIIDYATAKPQFEKWRDETLQRSGGKSMGNIRSMHGKIAAGKATAIDFDDVNKTVGIGAHIVDPVEAQKIRLGVLCGYSIGGGYLKRWPDPGNPGVMRYTPELTETSVVDSPCMPGALIQHIKMDGSTELIKAVGSGLEPPPTFSTRRSSKLEKPPVAAKSFGADVCPKCNEPMKDGKCMKCDKVVETGDLSKGVKYLVTEDDGTTHLPYTDESGKPDHAHMGAAHAALHGGYRGNKYEGPKKQEAKDKLKSLYESEKLDLPSEKWNGEGDLEKTFDAAQPRDSVAHFAPATTDDGSPHHGNVMRGQAAKAKASGDEMGAASLKATAASHDAYVEQTADAHDKAAKAHSDAAQVHRDGGNPVQGVIHDLHAAHHGNEANKLRAAEPVPASGPFAPNAPTADLPAPTMLSAGTPVDATFSARKAAEANLSKDAAGISTGTGLGFYDQDSTPGAEAKVKQCKCGGTLVDGICATCRKVAEKIAPDGLLEKYSEDQERDDHGRFGSGGGATTEEHHSLKNKDEVRQMRSTLKDAGFKPTGVRDIGHGTVSESVTTYAHPEGHSATVRASGYGGGHAVVTANEDTHMGIYSHMDDLRARAGKYLTSTFPNALAKRRSAPIDQRLQKSLWDVGPLAKQLMQLAKLEADAAPATDEVTALRKVFLDLAAEEAAGQITESANAGNRERFANGLQKAVNTTSLLKEFEVAGFSAKQ